MRADFDALAVEEQTNLPFSSEHPGLMHACGHDIHTAWLLTTLKILVESDLVPIYNLRFIFEDGEENPITPPGAVHLIKNGALENVKEIYGLHIWANPDIEPGTFCSRFGPFLANSGRLGIYLKASGGHVARANEGVNCRRISHEIYKIIMEFTDKHLEGTANTDYAVEPTSILAGEPDGKSSNIMPSQLQDWWGIRTFLPRKKHEKFMKKLTDKIRKVGTQMGGEVKFKIISGHPALINRAQTVERIQQILQQNKQPVNINHPPILEGESFAYYLEKVPGSFWMLGAWQEGCGEHHQSTFNPDSNQFGKGVLFFLGITMAKN